MVQLKWKDRMKPAELKHIYGVAQGLLPRLWVTLLVFKQALTRKGQIALSSASPTVYWTGTLRTRLD